MSDGKYALSAHRAVNWVCWFFYGHQNALMSLNVRAGTSQYWSFVEHTKHASICPVKTMANIFLIERLLPTRKVFGFDELTQERW